jgi:hypothetical protein
MSRRIAMRTVNQWFCLLAGVAVMVAVAHAKSDKVPLDKLPKAVVDAVKAKFPKAEMKEASSEKDGDAVNYEVTISDEGTKIDVNAKSDGTITGYEKTTALTDLPKAITDAVAAKYPKGKSKNAETVYTVKDGKDTLAFYEVFVEVDGKVVEVEVLPDGKLKS